MAALGSTHILFGGLGALAFVGLTLVAAVVAIEPSLIDVSKLPLHVTAEDLARTRSFAIGMTLLGLLRASTSVLLVVAGIRVLDVAPAGRRLSLAAAFIWTFTNVFEAFALGEPLWLFLVMTAYPLLTEWLFLRKTWRAAFAPRQVSDDGEPSAAP